jgi:3'(2'), 5'-bisphosphate nucleotidase
MDDLLQIARTSAREASSIIMAAYGSKVFSEKDDKSPVTVTDAKVHDLLDTELSKTGISVFSEEGAGAIHPYPERLWIIDPIDGTRGFINGTGDFAVMIGLLEKGRPVLGVLHLPTTNTQYYAMKGQGAFKVQGDALPEKLFVSDRHVPELIATQSINHSAPYMTSVAAALEVTETIKIGGIGVKAGIIAEARGDYFLTLGNLGEWDVCAPEIITLEAGGSVTDIHGDPLTYANADGHIQNGAVFSNSACHREVLTALSMALRPL